MLTKTPKSTAITGLVLEIFRLNGLLVASGDALVAGIGLTSARWQVLGAAALLQGRAPVAHIANFMGLTRQSVQRTADELEKAGIIEFNPNPHHKRARLVTLTAKGRALFDAAMRLQKPWAAALAAGIDGAALQTTAAALAQLRARLEQNQMKRSRS